MSDAVEVASPVDGNDQLPARTRWARRGYVLIAGLFVICVVIQVFIAGMAVFVDPANWARHMNFVHYFQYLPIGLLPLAFLGRFPRGPKLLPVGLLLLIEVQYVTADMFGSLVAAIHPVSAFVIFWIAVYTTQRAWLGLSKT